MKTCKTLRWSPCAQQLQPSTLMIAPPAISLSFLLIFSLASCVDGESDYTEELGEFDELDELDEDPTPTTVSMGSLSENGLSINGLQASSFYLEHFRYTKIGFFPGKESLNGLEPGSLLLNKEGAGDLPNSADGRALLKYISTCALPRDTQLIVSSEGQDYVFPGLLNLAPEWVEGECDEECQGWISACLMAHVNPGGENVAISLRGTHPELQPTPQEAATYSFEEGAFYGQVFTETPSLNACRGEDTLQNPLGAGGLSSRHCTEGQCGFNFAGLCYPFAGQSLCEGEPGVYDSCVTIRSSPFSETHSQIITVMLNPDTPFF